MWEWCNLSLLKAVCPVIFVFMVGCTLGMHSVTSNYAAYRDGPLRKVMGGGGKNKTKSSIKGKWQEKNSCKDKPKEKNFMQKKGRILLSKQSTLLLLDHITKWSKRWCALGSLPLQTASSAPTVYFGKAVALTLTLIQKTNQVL